jgi:hypothetical protein
VVTRKVNNRGVGTTNGRRDALISEYCVVLPGARATSGLALVEAESVGFVALAPRRASIDQGTKWH